MLDQLAEDMAGRAHGMAAGGDATAKALRDAEVHDVVMKLVQVVIALAGARWVPTPPTVPKPQRIDSIAATVLELTGWTSHRRLTNALRPYRGGSTSVGEAVQRAAQELGVERNGRSFEEFAGAVVAAAEARGRGGGGMT